VSGVLRDSTTAADIPLEGLAAAGGYGDGRYAWSSADWVRFERAGIPALVIVVNAAHAGDVLDVERGDAAPGDTPGWADRFRRAGRRRPTIYCNRSDIAAVRQAMGGRPFDWWAATLDGTTTGTSGAVAVQWKGSNRTGGHYDESIILDDGWIGGGDVALTNDDINRIWAAAPSWLGDYLTQVTQEVVNGVVVAPTKPGLSARLTAIQAKLDAIPVGGGLTTAQAQLLTDAAAALVRIEAALRGA